MLNFTALLSAFSRVKENAGCAGADGVTILQFECRLTENLTELSREIAEKSYLPLPVLRILVDKGNGEARALCVPAVRDRVAQTAVLNAIEPILEREFEDCSFGYRKKRSVRQAVSKIRQYYESGYRWVIDADIDCFFDSLDHALLMTKVKKHIRDENILGLVELWIKAEVWDGRSLRVMERGIPQGAPISPVLANLYLDELDETLLKKGYKVVRYADDFIVLCKTAERAREALDFADETLEKLILRLDEANVVSFDQGFRYLGVTFLRSMTLVPFEKPRKERRILDYPPPLNMDAYLLKRKRFR